MLTLAFPRLQKTSSPEIFPLEDLAASDFLDLNELIPMTPSTEPTQIGDLRAPILLSSASVLLKRHGHKASGLAIFPALNDSL